MKISKTLENLHVGDTVIVELKDSAVGKVQHQLIVGSGLMKNQLVLFDLTMAHVASEATGISADAISGELIASYLAGRHDVLRIFKE